MDDCIKRNTETFRARIAQRLGIAKQGLTNRLNNDPVRFLVNFLAEMVAIGEMEKARVIWADIRERVEILFNPDKPFSLVETIKIWQKIFVREIDGGNRFELLQSWRELALVARSRISELTLQLEDHKAFGC